MSTKYKQFIWPKNDCGLVNVDGGQIYYRLFGKDKPGVPLVFCHGGPGSNFSRYFALLSFSQDRPILLFTQLGSSGTRYDAKHQTVKKAQELMTIESYVKQLEQVIAHFGFDKYILLGHSWGSMLITEYAGANKRNGLVGLVCSSPFISGPMWFKDSERLVKSLPDGKEKWDKVMDCVSRFNNGEDVFTNNDFIDELNTEYTNNFGNRFPDRKAQIPIMPPKPMLKDDDSGQMIEADVYGYMWGPTEFLPIGTVGSHDSSPLLKDIDVPIMFICGQYDNASESACKEYVKLCKDAYSVVVKDAGHSCYFDQTEQYSNFLRQFLEKLQ